jgi:hypothetical protein
MNGFIFCAMIATSIAESLLQNMTNASAAFCHASSYEETESASSNVWEQAAKSKKKRDTRFTPIQESLSREDVVASLRQDERSSDESSATSP